MESGVQSSHDDEAGMSLKTLIFEKATNTGMHGIPNARRAHSFCRRAFWTALVLAGLCEY